MLRELEDAKLAGMDYPLSALLELRTLCQVAPACLVGGGEGVLRSCSVGNMSRQGLDARNAA